MFSFILNTIFI